MPYQLTLPRELAPAAQVVARDAVFQRRVFDKTRWSRPHFLLWLARVLHVEFVAHSATIVVVLAGFRGIARPWRILVALPLLLGASWRQRRNHVPCWGIPDNPPRRWSAPKGALRPSYYGSLAGPAPAPEAPPVLPFSAPTQPGGAPSRPRPQGIVHG